MSEDDGARRLVLTRKPGQGCVIYHADGSAQEVIVREVRGTAVRLMFQDIENAKPMNVWRSEVWDKREERGANE